MRFEVPQFINIEDKLFGSLTFKQFLYLAGGGGICYALYRILPIVIAIPLIIGVGGFAVALAFLKINGQPFIQIVEAFLKYQLNSKVYLWKRDNKTLTPTKQEVMIKKGVTQTSPMTQKSIKELAHNLDIAQE